MKDNDILVTINRLEMRQEALIRAVEKLAEVVEATRDSVDELLVWAQQPPSTDLPQTIGRLAECVGAMHVSLVELGHQLPGQVADAVQRAR